MSRPPVERIELDMQELETIVERASLGPLSEADQEKLKAALHTLGYVTQALESNSTTLQRLRKLLFGSSSEKTSTVLGEVGSAKTDVASPSSGGGGVGDDGGGDAAQGEHAPKTARQGHGRNGSAAYPGAPAVPVAHASLKAGDRCPLCVKGKVYSLEPAVIVRVTGQAPLQATRWELERLRCNLCGEVFTADAPASVGPQKYDAKATAMVGMLRYGTGLPFNRLEQLQGCVGIPLPTATQWDIVRNGAQLLQPAYAELTRQAAQGELLHNDDTPMKILALMGKRRGPPEPGERTGVFTSGIVARAGPQTIALFFTGRAHAGENLEKVLAERSSDLGPPIQMCDALSRNVPETFKTVLCNCLDHGRRKFVDVVSRFPEECRYVLETLRDVYHNDAITRGREMSAPERLQYHQKESAPLMQGLKEWMEAQLAEKKVEPNSGLGDAIQYMINHWEKLTRFLREAGAPLSNSICERALKKAIVHRKNSLFYRSENGARVGDIFMSLIHTAQLSKVDPFDYLVALQTHASEVAARPAEWTPWSYQESRTRLMAARSRD